MSRRNTRARRIRRLKREIEELRTPIERRYAEGPLYGDTIRYLIDVRDRYGNKVPQKR